MLRSKQIYWVLILVLGGALIPAHADDVFTDGTFNLGNYTQTINFSSVAFSVSQCTTCGNPGDALQITQSYATAGAFTDALINDTFSYNPLTQGAITSISASVDKDFTDTTAGGNTFHPTIEQGGVFYIASIPGTGITSTTGGTTGYLTISQTGLVASNFLSYNVATNTAGTANPNFDGSTMTFGLMQISGNGGGQESLTVDYDNLNLDLVTPSVPTPEPSSLLLLGVGLAGLMLISRRKLAVNN
jgi:hypothetical protein